MAPGHWLPSYLLSSNPHRAPSRQTAAVDELSSDSEEESEEDYELADAILASEIDYLNQEGYHAPVAQPITETQEYNRPSGSSRQPVETASYAQNLPATRHHYGSNEDVYNPYSPFTSKEYIEQEVAAGRMAVEDPNNKANHDSETSSQSIEGLQAAVQPTNRALNRAALRASQSRETAGRRNELDPSANLIGPAEFRSRMMRTLRIPYGQHAATPTPDSSNAPVLAAAPAPVNLSNTACTNSRHRRRGDTVVTSPRRRNGLMAMMRTPRNARAASSASTDAATPTLESQSSVARKRRRADRSPEDAVPIPFPPPRAPSAVGNRVAGSSARRASTGASGSLGLVRSDSELPGLTDRSSQRNHNPVGFDVDTQRLLLRLPDDIKHRILEYVLGINMGLPPPQGRRSLLPPRKDNTGRADFLFTSELMPRTFEAGKRKALLDIFRNRAPYVPAAIGKRIGQPTIQYHVTNGRPPNGGLPYMPHPVSSGEQGWPSNVLPTEVFQNIAGNLSRDDIQQMRLVNHEFELKVSNLLFRRVVVPFRPEIYGLIVQKDKPMEIIDFKGKGKAKSKEPHRSLR